MLSSRVLPGVNSEASGLFHRIPLLLSPLPILISESSSGPGDRGPACLLQDSFLPDFWNNPWLFCRFQVSW